MNEIFIYVQEGGIEMKAICGNCKYLGAIIGREDLVCSQTKGFESRELNDTCDNYVQDICESCGSDDIGFHRFSPDNMPYITRTEYSCYSCKSFWYEDI